MRPTSWGVSNLVVHTERATFPTRGVTKFPLLTYLRTVGDRAKVLLRNQVRNGPEPNRNPGGTPILPGIPIPLTEDAVVDAVQTAQRDRRHMAGLLAQVADAETFNAGRSVLLVLPADLFAAIRKRAQEGPQ